MEPKLIPLEQDHVVLRFNIFVVVLLEAEILIRIDGGVENLDLVDEIHRGTVIRYSVAGSPGTHFILDRVLIGDIDRLEALGQADRPFRSCPQITVDFEIVESHCFTGSNRRYGEIERYRGGVYNHHVTLKDSQFRCLEILGNLDTFGQIVKIAGTEIDTPAAFTDRVDRGIEVLLDLLRCSIFQT